MKSRKTKKRTLRTIDKDRLSVQELTETFQEIVGVSDRSAAILVAAHIDSALSDLIEAELLTSIEEDAIKPLYERDGALSTFFSKVHLGYAMSLYDDKVRDDLEVIRRVRNSFSHVRRAINFNTPEIADECKKFRTMNDHTHEVYKMFDREGRYDFEQLNNRSRFVLTGLSIWLHLMVHAAATHKKFLEAVKAVIENFRAQRKGDIFFK
jgi:DNA-binding MltR family transcriptional regulator